jgi:hypothetical protein
MKLFDEVEGIVDKSAGYTEPSFSYMNRTSREEFARMRDLLEVWYSRYPTSEQQELRSRFRSSNNFQHEAAFFELFLHELLLGINCKIKLHPSLQKTSKAPDFLVEPESSHRFYLEATVATGETANQTAARARENAVYDVLDRLVNSPDYFLSLSVQGSPKTPPPAKKLAKRINKEIGLLDYEEIRKIYESNGLRNLPCWQFEHDGWRIEIQPIPKSKLRGKAGIRPIGTRFTGIRGVDHRTPIRDSIVEKGRKYGELDLPYVVAVNALEPGIDQDDILEALFGKEQYLIDISDDASIVSEPRLQRIPDGAWRGPDGPRYTRISAVLMVTQLSIYNIPRAVLRLYHNPWAQNPYQSVLTQLNQAIPIDGKIHWQDGKNASTLFELPVTWPENTG